MPSPILPHPLAQDIAHLVAIFKLQGQLYSQHADGATQWAIFDLQWPVYEPEMGPYARVLAGAKARHEPMDYFAIRLFIALALAPTVMPQALDPLAAGDERGRPFTEYGGIPNPGGLAFLPSFQTGLFILAGNDLDLRFRFQKLLDADGFLLKEGLLDLAAHEVEIDPCKQRLCPTQAFLHLIIYGTPYSPSFGSNFPAQRLHSNLDWSDVVLHPSTLQPITMVQNWLKHRDALYADKVIGKRIKPGFRALFYGPSGTGKTLVATLLGKESGIPVYRVDLSQVVSKYIGETEKNLSRLFQQAAGKDWILFFDEADALFGKRTQTQSAHDRYANQEVAYLLQRLEDHPGLVILASNFKANMDEAFARRFQSMVQFVKPNFQERKLLWQKSLSLTHKLVSLIDIESIAKRFELTGAQIVNILQTAILDSLGRNELEISEEVLLRAIQHEYQKEERHFPG